MGFAENGDLPVEVTGKTLEMASGTIRRLLESTQERSWAELLFEQYERQIERLLNTRRVARLAHVTQFGVQRRGGVRFDDHNRLVHSGDVAGFNVAKAVHDRLTRETAKVLLVWSLVHDIGQFAFSHDQEGKLRGLLGFDHEKRGLELVRTDAQLRQAIADFDINPDVVVLMMREIEAFGHRGAFGDTASYCYSDPKVIGLPTSFDHSKLVFEAMRGIDDQGVIEATDVQPFKELVEMRALLHEQVYNQVDNRLTKAAVWMLLERLAEFDSSFWPFCARTTDRELLRRIDRYNEDSEPAIFSAKEIIAGNMEAAADWQVHDFASDAARKQFLDAEVGRGRPFMWYDPSPYWRKTFKVRTLDGQLHEVRADPANHTAPHVNMYRLYVFAH